MLPNLILCFYLLHVSSNALNLFQCGGSPNVTVGQIEEEHAVPMSDQPVSYGHIRIQTFEAISMFDNKFLAAVKKMVDFYQRLLSVHNLNQSLPVSDRKEGIGSWLLCRGLHYNDLKPSAKRKLEKKQDHTGKTYLVVKEVTDLVIYVTASSDCTGMIAWASPCIIGSENGRSLTGQINKCPGFDAADMTERKKLNALKHEFMHILGVGPNYFNFLSVALRSELRDWKVTKAQSWKKNTTFIAKATEYPKTLAALREHFDCEGMEGIELENSGPLGTANAHWEQLTFGNELMVGVVSEQMYFSKITAMYLSELRKKAHQQPIYQLDLRVIQSDMTNYWYGRKLGCTFAQKSCREYIDQAMKKTHLETPAFPFCTPENTMFAPLAPQLMPDTSKYTLPVCCGSRQVKTVCVVSKFQLQHDMKDDHGKCILAAEWIKKYGYFEDTEAKGYYGRYPIPDFCPVMYLDEMTDCTSGGFGSCKGDEITPAPDTTKHSTTRKGDQPTPPNNSPSKKCFLCIIVLVLARM